MRASKVLGLAGLVGVAAVGLALARRAGSRGGEGVSVAGPNGHGAHRRVDLTAVAGAGTPGSNGDRRPRSGTR